MNQKSRQKETFLSKETFLNYLTTASSELIVEITLTTVF